MLGRTADGTISAALSKVQCLSRFSACNGGADSGCSASRRRIAGSRQASPSTTATTSIAVADHESGCRAPALLPRAARNARRKPRRRRSTWTGKCRCSDHAFGSSKRRDWISNHSIRGAFRLAGETRTPWSAGPPDRSRGRCHHGGTDITPWEHVREHPRATVKARGCSRPASAVRSRRRAACARTRCG